MRHPVGANPTSPERARLRDLAIWSAGLGNARWVMAWTWLNDNQIVSDYFDPGERGDLLSSGAISRSVSGLENALWRSAPPFVESFGGQAIRGLW